MVSFIIELPQSVTIVLTASAATAIIVIMYLYTNFSTAFVADVADGIHCTSK